MRWVSNATPRPLYPWERLSTHCIGGWVGPRAGLDGCWKFSPPNQIRSTDRPVCSESLYRQSYPSPPFIASSIQFPQRNKPFVWAQCGCWLGVDTKVWIHQTRYHINFLTNRLVHRRPFLSSVLPSSSLPPVLLCFLSVSHSTSPSFLVVLISFYPSSTYSSSFHSLFFILHLYWWTETRRQDCCIFVAHPAWTRGLPPLLSVMLWDQISLLLSGYWGLSQFGLNLSHFEGDNSPPSSCKINYAWC